MKEIKDFIVLERQQSGSKYFRLLLQQEGVLQKVEPGQFVEVRIDGCQDVMLRRPISINDADEERGTLSLLIQIVGRGTKRLSEMKVGERLNVVYPLGKGFSKEGEKPLLVGGGAGIAPLLLLAKRMMRDGVKPTVILGGRTAELIPFYADFEPYATLYLATDDGTLGRRGTVVEHPAFGDAYDHIYTCGPTGMMRAVARDAARRGIGCEVSLENMMACGIGACLCCVEETERGRRCVCKEGPVFDTRELTKWMNG